MAAVRGTLVAIFMLAVLAVVAVLRAHRASAVIAGRTSPVVKGYERAFLVVGIQNVPDNSEKIIDSTFFKSRLNCAGAFPFTKFIAVDVRVGNFVIRRGRMRFESDYKVRGGVVHLFELIQL
jgi:hypothetical protein